MDDGATSDSSTGEGDHCRREIDAHHLEAAGGKCVNHPPAAASGLYHTMGHWWTEPLQHYRGTLPTPAVARGSGPRAGLGGRSIIALLPFGARGLKRDDANCWTNVLNRMESAPAPRPQPRIVRAGVTRRRGATARTLRHRPQRARPRPAVRRSASLRSCWVTSPSGRVASESQALVAAPPVRASRMRTGVAGGAVIAVISPTNRWTA